SEHVGETNILAARSPLPPPAWFSPSAQSDGKAALHAGTGHHGLVPPLDVAKIRQVDLVTLMPPSPAENREIGYRNAAPGELDFPEPLVEYAVETPRLFRVALKPVTPILLVGDLQEMVHLAGHRTKAAHLPHQPFEHRHLPAQFGRPEFSGLLTEIDEDCTGFENADRQAAGSLAIDDRGNLAVGTDFDESGGELLALGDVHGLHRIRHAHLFERHADLSPVR